MNDSSSEFVCREPCPSCGSHDNLARYSDGHAYCFGMGCSHYEPGTDGNQENAISTATTAKPTKGMIPAGEPSAWGSRGINLETASKWGFTRSEMGDQTVRVFNYRDSSGRIVAQKVRTQDKDFRFLGDTKSAGLYGQHLCRDGGRRLVITEGEIDAMSVSQMQGHKWPVVSIPNGAQGARKSLEANLQFLEQYDEVVLLFDGDEAGQAAAQECLKVPLTPGKLKIAKLPLKDANAMLQAGRVKETIDALWAAKVHRPDGLVGIEDLLEELATLPAVGLPWWMPELTAVTLGRRWGEVYGFGAGTGVGKTDWFTQQIAFDVNELGLKVGVIYLEQKPAETVRRIAGKSAGKMFHLPPETEGGDIRWTQEDLQAEAERLQGNVFLYDSWGQTEWDAVRTHIRYLAGQGVRVFYLDHLTALADTADEKGSLEQIMKEMAGLANELQIIIHFVSHLTTPDGKPHEEGGRVTVRHFKGSRAIGFWSYFMFGLERDQQADDPNIRTTTVFRVLKDRHTGRSTGQTFLLGFNPEEGRLFPREDNPFEEEKSHDFKNEEDPF